MDYHLYCFETIKPIREFTGKCSSKAGIAKDLDNRNCDYQQCLGPDYPFQFDATWVGPENEIRWLEKQILKHFNVKRCAEIRALSEWIKDTRASEVISYVETIIKEKRLLTKRID